MTISPRPSTLDRWSGGCLIAAGVLLLPGMLHPDIFETTLADAARTTPLWVPMHIAAIAVAVLTLAGLTGLYAARARLLGRLGAIGFALVVPGLVMTASVAYAEAFLLPVIARRHPELFAWDGPITTDWAIRLTTGMALFWLVGLVLVGLALWRAGAMPARAALTLAAATAVWPVFGGLLIPVLSPLSTVAVAVGYFAVGTALWSGRTGRTRAADRDPMLTGAPEHSGGWRAR
jgi:hypothetical protein